MPSSIYPLPCPPTVLFSLLWSLSRASCGIVNLVFLQADYNVLKNLKSKTYFSWLSINQEYYLVYFMPRWLCNILPVVTEPSGNKNLAQANLCFTISRRL